MPPKWKKTYKFPGTHTGVETNIYFPMSTEPINITKENKEALDRIEYDRFFEETYGKPELVIARRN